MLKYYVIAVAVVGVAYCIRHLFLAVLFMEKIRLYGRAIEYPNYPFIISYILMGAITSFAIVFLRRKQGMKTW